MNNLQKTAVLTALKKAIEQALTETRPDADYDLIELYGDTGADRVKVKLGNTEIGTFSLVFEKEGYLINDKAAFDDFLLANGFGSATYSIRPEYMGCALTYMLDNCPQGVIEHVVINDGTEKLFEQRGDAIYIVGTDTQVDGISPKRSTIKQTRLTGCDPKKVVPILNELPNGLAGLLAVGEGEC